MSAALSAVLVEYPCGCVRLVTPKLLGWYHLECEMHIEDVRARCAFGDFDLWELEISA
jgi:hypothetical protein